MKKLFITFLMSTFALSFTGCAPQQTAQQTLQEAAVSETVLAEAETSEESISAPKEITITHELGETKLMTKPGKVVTFDYAVLDSLKALDISVTGLPKSNVPSYLEEFKDEKYESVGSLFEPDYEKLFALKPDVIFISGRQIDLYEELTKIAPTVFLPTPAGDYLNAIKSNLQILGEIFEKEEEVQTKLGAIEASIQEIRKEASQKDKNALVVLINEGALSAYGLGSRFGMIHETFGFLPTDTEIEVSRHGQSISYEYISQKNPDYMFVVDRAVVVGGSVSAKEAFDNALVQATNAYRDNRIIYLNPEVWYVSSGGIQGTQMMINEMKEALLK